MNGKKLLILFLVAFMVIGITGCKKNKEKKEDKNIFSMEIKNIYDTDRGTIVSGVVDKGQINLYDEVVIDDSIVSTIISIETQDGNALSASEGDNVAFLLKNVSSNNIKTGQKITLSISNKVEINSSYDNNGPLLMGIDSVYAIDETSSVVRGKIYRGKISENEPIQIIGLDNDVITTSVQAIELESEIVSSAKAGDVVSVFLNDVKADSLKIGQTVVYVDSISTASEFDAKVSILDEEESGNKSSLKDNTKYSVSILSADTDALVLLDDEEELTVGDKDSVKIKLDTSVSLEIGMEFTIKENNIIVAKGTITEIY